MPRRSAFPAEDPRRRRVCRRAPGALAAALALALLAPGCSPREEDEARVSPEESILLERLQRDPELEIIDRARGDDGFLVVTTQQGDTQARYLLAPDSPASKKLTIRRMDESFSIESAVAKPPGVMPDTRGLPP